ncbi:MAG: PASTA domain-containing protein, partial [Parasporobacterium sp.]|nr:PASTA domain-containing protein [Parasporobacterium sp.]
DFGIARTTTANTISQDILGSVHYISPEQARGGQVDERSDIYSFGIVFYEMVTGELPFDGDSTVTIALKHIQESVPLVSDIVPGIPSSVVRIIEKCTQKKPERRYQKMSSLLADLKTSLISPNEDFVVLEPETQENATILMTDADARVLRSGAESSGHHREDFEEYENEYDGEYDDEYAVYSSEYDPYDDDYEEYEDDYKEKKGPRKKFDKVLLICGIVAGVIVLIVLAVVVTRTISSGSGGCGGKKAEEKMTVEMVDVVGKNVQEAKKTLEDAGLSVELKYEPSNDVPEECVISQSVSAGTRVDSQSKITLTVSSGQSTIKLSNYTNKTQKEAEDDLKKLGISTKVTNQYDENIETGKVIKTNPAAGSDISKSTVVELIVSRGKETKTVNMPDLVGFTKEDATGILTQDKLTYDITTQETDKEQVGKVISQSIAAETPVEEGTLVVLTIGVEPQVVLVTVPSLIGYTQDEAVSMLKNAGLEVGSVTTEEGDPGIVVAQGVDAGSSVAQGTAIAIVVGEHHEPEPEPQTETNANTDELE